MFCVVFVRMRCVSEWNVTKTNSCVYLNVVGEYLVSLYPCLVNAPKWRRCADKERQVNKNMVHDVSPILPAGPSDLLNESCGAFYRQLF